MSSVACSHGAESEVSGVDVAGEVVAKVQDLHRGDVHTAGEWLATFQRSDSAWQVCVEILRSGPAADRVPLQFFAAQTLARISRAFPARVPVASRSTCREELGRLLGIHGQGSAIVWRQLALATTCADLMLATWTAEGIMAAGQLPRPVRRELLALPPDLLFCERALPLDDASLWQQAACALANSCDAAFGFLLQDVGADEACSVLAAVAAWLRALRKSAEWLPDHDRAAPLRGLSPFMGQVLVLSRAAPAEAAEVAQQLALWGDCDREVSMCLEKLLQELLPRLSQGNHFGALLPLLSDLTSDRLPRAIMGELALDWQCAVTSALALLGEATVRALQDDLAGCEAEEAFGVWKLLAMTLRKGTWWGWRPSVEQLQNSGNLLRCFQLFSQRTVDTLHLHREPQDACVEALLRVREAAEAAVAEWAHIFGGTSAWEEVMWQPLRCVSQSIDACSTTSPSLQLCWSTEVAMWWAATLAASAHERNSPCVGSAVLELGLLDAAPAAWRALLWFTASGLACSALGDVCQQLLPWVLDRSPAITRAQVPWIPRHTELGYARAVELLARQLPAGTHMQHAERIARLALEPIPAVALHATSAESRGVLLRACRRVLGGDAACVCSCLSQAVLAPLRQAVEAEAASCGSGSQWPAVQVLCEALVVALPEVEDAGQSGSAAAVAVWQANWDCMQASLLKWTPSATTNQPVEAASDALASAALVLRPLLQPTLQLLVDSISQRAQPHAQIQAVCRIATGIQVPASDLSAVGELLAEAVLTLCQALLACPAVLLQNPATLEALYRLLAACIQLVPVGKPADQHLCGGHLRPRLLGQAGLVRRCLEVVADALPECPRPSGVEWTLIFVSRLLKGMQAGREVHPNLRELLRLSVPQLCVALTQALACQPQLAKIECIHYAAEVLLQVADVFPEDAPAALRGGVERLAGLGVPEYSRHRLERHVLQRSEWASFAAWIDGLQQIAHDWQNERRQSIT